MKRSWIGVLAVGVTFAASLIAACGSSADNGDLCIDEGGFCTSASQCGAVLPFGCGTSSNVCCAPGAASPLKSAGGPVGTAPAPTATATAAPSEDSGPVVTTTMDSGPATTVDSAPTETMDTGVDSPTETDSPHDAHGG